MRPARSMLVLLAALGPGLAGADEASAGPGMAPAFASSREAAAAPDEQPARPSVVPTQALLEKLGRADRLFLSGDHRNALFAYQDAVYMQPGYAPARVRLGRAYLKLRYPAQAIAQAEAALAADPESADARTLLAEAGAAASPEAGPQPAPAAGTRVFRLVPQGGPPAREPASADATPQPR